MKVRKLLSVLTASVALMFGLVGVATAAPVNSNGSFEGGVSPGLFLPISAVNNTSINNWSVSHGNIDYIGTYWVSSDGSRSIDLTGSNGSPGAISTTFSTVPGHTYVVTFDLAGNPAGPPSVKTVQVDAGGAPVAYHFDVSGKTLVAMGWTEETFNFIATGLTTTLTFRSMDPGFYGPAIDNVVVTDLLTDKNQCKNGGWAAYNDPSFRNQGDCVSYIESNPNAVGNRADNE